jgi:hypothetical protein
MGWGAALDCSARHVKVALVEKIEITSLLIVVIIFVVRVKTLRQREILNLRLLLGGLLKFAGLLRLYKYLKKAEAECSWFNHFGVRGDVLKGETHLSILVY